jgi:methyl-accepting chemotaxis protein
MEGNDSFGHFVPYWFRYDDLFLQEPTYAYGKDWYDIPKQTKSEMVVDPTVYLVNNEDVMLVTLEAPIVHDGTFYGLTGVDISINWLQERIKQSNLYDGEARLSIVSNNGTVAATSAADTIPGKMYVDVFGLDEQQMLALERGKAGSVQLEHTLKVYSPILIGEGKTPWQVIIDIPLALITAEAQTQMYRSIYISLTLLLVILLSIFLFVSRLVKPLSSMVEITEKMAKGVLDTRNQIEYSNDEIGLMAGALEHLSDGLQRTSSFANKVGEGDLDAEFQALSEDDMLGNALVEMRENLKSIAAEDEKRNWVTKGQAEFGEILRLNNDNLKELSYNIIHHTFKYP